MHVTQRQINADVQGLRVLKGVPILEHSNANHAVKAAIQATVLLVTRVRVGGVFVLLQTLLVVKNACGEPSKNSCPPGSNCLQNACIGPSLPQCGLSQCGTAGGKDCIGPFGTNACPTGFACTTFGPPGTPQMNMCISSDAGATPWNGEVVLDHVLGKGITPPSYLNMYKGLGTAYANLIPNGSLTDINGYLVRAGPLVTHLSSGVPIVFNNLSLKNAYSDFVAGDYGNLPHQTNLQVAFITDKSQVDSFSPSKCGGGACRELGGCMPCMAGLNPLRVSEWYEVPDGLPGKPTKNMWFSIWACDNQSIQCPAGFIPSTVWDTDANVAHYGCQRLQPKPNTNPCQIFDAMGTRV